MAVNKNFVVKNGLEVNENLIVANIDDNAVGVGTSTPNYQLHVFGGIGATDVRVTGVSSFISNLYVGTSGTTFSVITQNDASGRNPQVGIGTDLPAYPLDIRSAVSTGQTALYVQGDARITGDLIADDIVLDQASFTNIDVSGFTTTRELVVGYGASVTGVTTLGHLSRATAGSGGTSLTFNPAAGISTNFQVIGNTYLEGGLKIKADLDVDTNIFIVGIVTAGTIHVGTALTVAGISTFMSDVYVGGNVATGLQIAGVTTTASSGGITTTGGDLYVGNNLFIKDDITVDTNLNILGVATVGVLSARDAVVSGASTVNGNVTIGGTTAGIGSIYLPDNSRLSLGTGAGDLIVYHDGSHSYIDEIGTGGLYIRSLGANNINIGNSDEDMAIFKANGGVELFYDDTKRFETTSQGSIVTGILTATGIGSFGSSVNVVGAQFVGGDLTVGGDLNVTGDISYDEVTGRNLNITGIATIHTLGVTSTTTTQDLKVGAGATIDNALDIGSTIKMDATSGVITATTFSGVGEVIGIGSEGTPIGTGVSFIDFRSTTGAAFSCQPAVNGIATVTVTPGVSLGLAIALGG